MNDAEKWKRVAEGLEIKIPREQIERIAPVLEQLAQSSRRALDHDLSLTEPVFAPGKR